MKIDIPPRRVIPRWRDSSRHLVAPESVPLDAPASGVSLPENYWLDLARAKVEEWNADPTPGMAADVLSLAVFPETLSILAPVAHAVRETGTTIPPSLDRLVRRVLREPETTAQVSADSRTAVQHLRQRLRNSYENPIALIDYARHQITLGNAGSADRAVRMACTLAPQDRFVIRSAARFYVHIGDPDHALQIISKSGRAISDPWLLSCEISVSSVAGRASRNIRHAREVLGKDSLPPAHLTELASAVATLELDSGRLKEARRLFRLALRKPNDNAVSQAQWAAMEAGMPFAARSEWLQGQNFHELRCLRAHNAGEFQQEIIYAREWHDDEPFSSRPLVMASHINGVLGDFKAAESFAMMGLASNPRDSNLLNNLVYAYANQGKLNRAIALMRKIVHIQKDGLLPQSIANIGCLLIRTGEYEQGINAYRAAIARSPNQDFAARALAFLARELHAAGHPKWQAIKAESETLIAKQDSLIASTVLHTIDPKTAIPSARASVVAKAGRWVYNKAKNLLILERDRII